MPNPDLLLETRLLTTLQELQQQPALSLSEALTAAAHRVCDVLGCEKTDAFLLDEAKASLVALGTSRTPLGDLQKALGLDYLPLASGGRPVAVFKSGQSHLTGNAEDDPEELPAVVRELGVRSGINVPLDVSGVRRGVLSAVSIQHDFFGPNDLRFLEVVAGWVGSLVHRAELVEQVRQTESRNARRAVADELVTVLAHDLRNHIHPLLGRLHLLKFKLAEGQPPSLEDMEAVLRSAERMSRMTSEMLDVARLDQGLFAIQPQTVDVAAIAREVARYMSTGAVSVEVSAPPQVQLIGDPERLRQALENVVANAVKHSPAGKAVQVQVSIERELESYVLIAVTDQGPGIHPDVLPRLFERFSSGGLSAGLGLGLHLARQIAKAHQGSLELSSNSHDGAQLCFRLPLG